MSAAASTGGVGWAMPSKLGNARFVERHGGSQKGNKLLKVDSGAKA